MSTPTNRDAEQARIAEADKRIAAVRARLALAGFTAHVIGHDLLLIARWGRTRELSLADAEQFAKTVEGNHAA